MVPRDECAQDAPMPRDGYATPQSVRRADAEAVATTRGMRPRDEARRARSRRVMPREKRCHAKDFDMMLSRHFFFATFGRCPSRHFLLTLFALTMPAFSHRRLHARLRFFFRPFFHRHFFFLLVAFTLPLMIDARRRRAKMPCAIITKETPHARPISRRRDARE